MQMIQVGILKAPQIAFEFQGHYVCEGNAYTGRAAAAVQEGRILFNNKLYDSLTFVPQDAEKDNFLLYDVVIGIDFHWERKENQRFTGVLKLIVEDGALRAVNCLDLEDYLVSVIASEMSASAKLEYLKSHAVISRSWLLSQIEKRAGLAGGAQPPQVSETRTETTWIKWWDREDHILFDVCADDHCQRYQGITRPSQSWDKVRAAVGETRGQVLVMDGAICDARFSKCCGGVMEEFQTCWEDKPHRYLQAVCDIPGSPLAKDKKLDLTDHVRAREWIMGSPAAFCNTTDKEILSQVLNSYDQETQNFYRWEEHYTAAQLTDLIKRRIGLDFGVVTDLVPEHRGPSGRIDRLRIEGSKMTMVIGKELLIRKALSESHLYSSAFVADKTPQGDFILHGAGWGHGVGFCQIGAAVMAYRGYAYDAILKHYFPGASLETR